jgi:hypothetical protein
MSNILEMLRKFLPKLAVEDIMNLEPESQLATVLAACRKWQPELNSRLESEPELEEHDFETEFSWN